MTGVEQAAEAHATVLHNRVAIHVYYSQLQEGACQGTTARDQQTVWHDKRQDARLALACWQTWLNLGNTSARRRGASRAHRRARPPRRQSRATEP